MKHYFIVPVVDKKATGKHIFEIAKNKGFSDKDLQTLLYDKDDPKNQQGNEEISLTTIYNWKNGTDLPDLEKLIRMSYLFGQRVINIVQFDYTLENVSQCFPKDDLEKKGTMIHARNSKKFFFDEEIVSFKQFCSLKSIEDHWDFIGYEVIDDVHDLFHFNIREFNSLIPKVDDEEIKTNLSDYIKKSKFKNRLLKQVLHQNNIPVIQAWRSGQSKPKTSETLLPLLYLLNISLEDLWNPCFEINVEKLDTMQFEQHYSEIANRDEALIVYSKILEKRMKEAKLEYPDYQFQFEEWNKLTVEKLIEKFNDFLDFQNSDEQSFLIYQSAKELYKKPEQEDTSLNEPVEFIQYVVYRIVKYSMEDMTSYKKILNDYLEVLNTCFKEMHNQPNFNSLFKNYLSL